jgi:hypothetical protein
MIDDYLDVLQEYSGASRMSDPIVTKDGVEFRTIIGREELKHLVIYKLPDSDTYKIVGKDWLLQKIGEERYATIFAQD